jgi:hypothetical protein
MKEQQIKTLQIIHLALSLGVIAAYYFLSDINSIDELLVLPKIDGNNIYIGLLPITAYVVGNILFRNAIKKIDKKLSLEESLGAYQTASLIRWSILEGVSFLIIFNFSEFTLFGIALVIYLVLLRPSENTIKKDLGK